MLFVLIRVCIVFLVQTWFVPDEYWQTVEVAHHIAFGYGHLTWEWRLGIRSYIYPVLLASVFAILKFLNADSVAAVIYAPRILQAVLSGIGDYYFWKWYRSKNMREGSWAIFCLCTNWFWLYTGSRTLINAFEATLNTIALSLFPWQRNQTSSSFLWVVSVVCMIRPTAAVVWLPLCLYHIAIRKKSLVLMQYLYIGVTVGLAAFLLDSYFYGQFIFTPLQFFRVNVMKDIGVFYGKHPFHWYLTAGIPVVLGSHLLPFLLGVYKSVKDRNQDRLLVVVIFWTLTVLSFVPHKEFRFLLPLMPAFVYIESKWLSYWSQRAHTSLLWLVAIVMFISNVILLGYLGLVHQRGTVDVIQTLSAEDPSTTKLMFLMPCHSTPLYSHLHSPMEVKFLTCEPDFTGNPHYLDEADVFYNDPEKWLLENVNSYQNVSHIVMFDVLYPSIYNFLTNNQYKLINSLFHSFHSTGRIGKFVQVYRHYS